MAPSPDALHRLVVLAHQGGWDELLMVAAPVAVFAVLLKIASRRANDLGEPRDQPERREL